MYICIEIDIICKFIYSVVDEIFFDYLQKYETLQSLGAATPRDSSDEVSLLHIQLFSLFSTSFFTNMIIYYRQGVQWLTLYAFNVRLYVNYVYA